MATILYNSRIVSYRQMKELDKVLDSEPTSSDVMQMVELRIQNLLAFDELQTFNDTGSFRYKHPLIQHKSERAELERLLHSDPKEFLRRYRCVTDSISRYERYLRDPSKIDKKKNYRALLTKYKDKDLLFKTILESVKQ